MVGDDAELLDRIDAAFADGAQVRPAVTEVELVDELRAGLELANGRFACVDQAVDGLVFPVRSSDPVPASRGELVQVGAVPAGEGIINRLGELSEGVAAGGGEDPAGTWPEVLATSLDEIDADGQPGAAHALIVSDGRGFQRVGGVVGELFGALQGSSSSI
jgi:hypothetical protein